MTAATATAWIASIAGLAMACSPLLQLRLVLTGDSCEGVSLGWLAVITVGAGTWTARGLVLDDLPLILVNGVGMLAAAATLAAIWRSRAAARRARADGTPPT